MAHLPNTDVVTVAWLKTLSSLPPLAIATSLPGDVASWANTGFVQAMSVGGTPGVHVPLQSPIVQIDCWAATPNSQKAPWGKAGALAEAVYLAAVEFDRRFEPVLPGDFETARILSVYPISEPRKMTGDEAGFARYTLEIALAWTVVR
ncbi:hypothetical protein GCM10017691_23880 [Pseudonocardia petroleophila]|uniref:Uncharacterized protein n=1 Tax=Pseudonocardia petroleophila TaxID=37331 RepID=A0A7G7MFV5_9PSEU|nr:hypothetical protein [Pseudonocardia petroleophila]QNG51666.1 hypothetical protein H6H00_26760 [Pseudonocardia petroleophila]